MAAEIAPLTTSILSISYFGDVVFAFSGALTAARYRMDVVGFVLIGTVTGIGGGTIRDLLLGRAVWWTKNPFELVLCMVAALATFVVVGRRINYRRGMIWADACPAAIARPAQRKTMARMRRGSSVRRWLISTSVCGPFRRASKLTSARPVPL